MNTGLILSNAFRNLNKRGTIFWAIVCILTVILLGVIDLLTGYEFSFSLFYLAPIFAASWFAGLRLGLIISAASTATWLFADLESGSAVTTPLVTMWNILIRFWFFAVVSLLLDRLRDAYQKEQELARMDRTTGVSNSRYFYELAQFELEHARRFVHPFTIAYMDLDNFKEVNDRLGHAGGDEVLQTVCGNARRLLRATDVIARLGGDEFAILLPGTDRTGAEAVLSKIHSSLMTEMQSHDWPVTFSIGVVTFTAPPISVDAMIHSADELMYSVKRETKNGVRYENLTG